MEGFTKTVTYECEDCLAEFETEKECAEHVHECPGKECKKKYLGKFFVSRGFKTEYIYIYDVCPAISYMMLYYRSVTFYGGQVSRCTGSTSQGTLEDIGFEPIGEEEFNRQMNDWLQRTVDWMTSEPKEEE